MYRRRWRGARSARRRVGGLADSRGGQMAGIGESGATAPLQYQTIGQLAAQYAARQLSPVEVTRALLERIERLDGALQSYATVTAESALAAARRAEDEIAAGRARGRLHGVPIAVKDLCFTRGVPTMGGTKALAEHVPSVDATVVTRLAEA